MRILKRRKHLIFMSNWHLNLFSTFRRFTNSSKCCVFWGKITLPKHRNKINICSIKIKTRWQRVTTCESISKSIAARLWPNCACSMPYRMRCLFVLQSTRRRTDQPTNDLFAIDLVRLINQHGDAVAITTASRQHRAAAISAAVNYRACEL